MNIEIKQEDINVSQPKSGHYKANPVIAALKREGYMSPVIVNNYISFTDANLIHHKARLTPSVIKYLANFENGEEVKPMFFIISNPKY